LWERARERGYHVFRERGLVNPSAGGVGKNKSYITVRGVTGQDLSLARA